MSRLGPETIPACERTWPIPLASNSIAASPHEGLERIAVAHPEERDRCVAILTRQLERIEDLTDVVGGHLVGYLLDLKAVESAPAIEAAFAAGVVDPMVAGDWPEVRYELGLGPMPESLRERQRRIAASVSPTTVDGKRPDLKRFKHKQKAARKQKGKSRGTR